MKRNRRKKIEKIGLDEYVRIQRSFSRQEEFEKLGPGFHSKSRVHDSAKVYTRHKKHKGAEDL